MSLYFHTTNDATLFDFRLAIHSEVPFEAQLEAFNSAADQVKIVVATNAVESSVTLPDVDHVICFGTASVFFRRRQTSFCRFTHYHISIVC